MQHDEAEEMTRSASSIVAWRGDDAWPELTEDGVVRLERGCSHGHEHPRARGSHDGGLLDTAETVDVVRTSILS